MWPILVVSLVYFAAWPPIVSLAESVTVHAARLGRADYGRVRLWGSFSFIAAAALAGQVLAVAHGGCRLLDDPRLATRSF